MPPVHRWLLMGWRWPPEAPWLTWWHRIVRRHPSSHALPWYRVAVLVESGRGWRYPRSHTLSTGSVTVLTAAVVRGCRLRVLSVVRIANRRLSGTTVEVVLGGLLLTTSALVSILPGLTLLGCVSELDLAGQDPRSLHRVNALLGGLMASEFDEAEALRVLGYRVVDDLGVVATWEVFLERGEENLIVDARVKVAHVDL